ncbi:MAG: bifunctional oligoribonuclease/PAP phosphatase NrnA [Elusimicrobia bacterium]|nr:bifunctional oligoribonuclease/PAP phosphatase NrnA [Elusimicrobiota bacterium]
MKKSLLDVIRRKKRFLVTMHAHPDPDAMGSALAMTLFLKSIGKDVRLINEDACPRWLAFMPRVKLCQKYTGRERFAPEVVVVLDCGDLERIGKVRSLVPEGALVINIDHHITNTHFGDWNDVRARYSSTAEILYQVLKNAECRFDRDIATLLYLGILTDTGSFGFDCTGPHTHEVIAELLRFGLPVSRLYQKVYETIPVGDLRGFLSLMNRLEISCGGRLAVLSMTRREADVFSRDFDVKDKVFQMLRSVKGLQVIMIAAEVGPRRTRINFRSRDGFDVARLAARFGGGGHKKASGCFLDKGLKQAREAVLSEIRKGL